MRVEKRAVGRELRGLHQAVSRYLEYNAKKSGIDEITMMHGWILCYLYENREKEVFQKDIEKTFSIGRSTVTNLIQILEKKEYVLRESVERDARLKRVILTEKGIKSNEMLKAMFDRMNQVLEKGISREELEVFFGVCDKIHSNLKSENVKYKGGVECCGEFCRK